jgi:hypothetical protein
VKVRRVAAGLYTVETYLGVFEVARVDSHGHGLYEPTKMTEWLLTWPLEAGGEYMETFPTLGAAKTHLAALLTNP